MADNESEQKPQQEALLDDEFALQFNNQCSTAENLISNRMKLDNHKRASKV